MPDEFESHFKKFAEQESKKDPVIKLGTPPHEYPQRFSEWRTRAQLVLEHQYTELQHLLHERSLFGCAYNEHAQHPLCKLEGRLQNLLKTVSLIGTKYQTPRLHRYELGDEKAPNTPLSDEQKKIYEMIRLAADDFEKELAKFKAAGANFQNFVEPQTVAASAPQLTFAQQAMARARDPQPVTPAAVQTEQQRLSQIAADREVQTLREAIADQGVSSVERPTQLGFNPLEQPTEFLQSAIQFYLEQNLPEWAPSAGLESRIRNLSPEKRSLIERELQEGSIAMLMPGRAIQEQTLAKAVQQLKPLWIENNKRKTVNAPYQWDWVEKLINDKNAALFQGVPNNPYILLAKPLQAPPQNTVSKTVPQQIAEFQRMKQERPELHATNISGYIALRSWATRAQNREGVQVIQPLDSVTFTRFIDLPISGGNVPIGDFNPVNGRLRFVGNNAANPYSAGGFRLEVMVEI